MTVPSFTEPRPEVAYRITAGADVMYAEYCKGASIPVHNPELGKPMSFRRIDLQTRNYFPLYQGKRGEFYDDNGIEIDITEATPKEIRDLRYPPSL